jgi:transcriptional regulator with XRE-family HTH domain
MSGPRLGRRPKTEAERQFDVQLGSRLCAARKAMRLTTAEFSSRAGISTQQLYQYEAGNNAISLRMMIIFSRILHVPLAELIQIATFNMFSENRCVGCARND